MVPPVSSLPIPTFTHRVDPQPERAYPFPNDSFYEVAGRFYHALRELRHLNRPGDLLQRAAPVDGTLPPTPTAPVPDSGGGGGGGGRLQFDIAYEHSHAPTSAELARVRRAVLDIHSPDYIRWLVEASEYCCPRSQTSAARARLEALALRNPSSSQLLHLQSVVHGLERHGSSSSDSDDSYSDGEGGRLRAGYSGFRDPAIVDSDEEGHTIIADVMPPHQSQHTGRKGIRPPLLDESFPDSQAGFWIYDAWTPITSLTLQAALMSSHCAMRAADTLVKMIAAGSASGQAGGHLPISYSLARPPGHHASSGRGGGYCYFNNTAVAVRYMQGLLAGTTGPDTKRPRVTILDIDYHHGNGTQDIFYEDPSVQYVSLHASPSFGGEPYFSGHAEETGAGPGVGFTVNIPLAPPITDRRYFRALARRALPAIRDFAPEVVVVSLGCDITRVDPLAHMGGIGDQTLARVGQAVRSLGRPVLVIHEGGYNSKTIGRSIASFFSGLVNDLPTAEGLLAHTDNPVEDVGSDADIPLEDVGHFEQCDTIADGYVPAQRDERLLQAEVASAHTWQDSWITGDALDDVDHCP
ncbi:hypothetical protein H696_03435 [Fonticula alba]|uniref:Histone deacetylase domain-containing protein n=1 Tax=Fonticula alba TaxID=691883 RepID=A0A058Z6W2_FONAL|nr:hypothetical protein H696_03435 [Fonticula alba]KCV69970.1 hypothetical protein H696_03435 [Fonticula alba]|eukprot:XP_009495576.1 hypothetical protein H696_03435 [Fonticula alba]